MTATPFTNDPIQLFKLLNLLKTDNYFPENFEDFKDLYLDDNYKFRKENEEHKIFLNNITGYISYLNREKDARQFAYPIIYNEQVLMSSSNNKLIFDVYKNFMEDIDKYIEIDLEKTKDILSNFKEQLKDDKKNLKKTTTDISQEEALLECMNDKKNKNLDIEDPSIKIKEMNDYVKEMTKIIKEKEKEMKKVVKVAKNKEDFEIVDMTEDFIEFELFYHIEGILGKYEDGVDPVKLGVRIPILDFNNNFEELGQGIIDYGIDDGILIKNTKKECVIDVEDIRFTITFKKDKKFFIYILTPIIKNK